MRRGDGAQTDDEIATAEARTMEVGVPEKTVGRLRAWLAGGKMRGVLAALAVIAVGGAAWFLVAPGPRAERAMKPFLRARLEFQREAQKTVKPGEAKRRAIWLNAVDDWLYHQMLVAAAAELCGTPKRLSEQQAAKLARAEYRMEKRFVKGTVAGLPEERIKAMEEDPRRPLEVEPHGARNVLVAIRGAQGGLLLSAWEQMSETLKEMCSEGTYESVRAAQERYRLREYFCRE